MRLTARLLPPLAPLPILVAWFAANQWSLAGAEPKAWLTLSAVLGLAVLLPLPRQSSRVPLAAGITWWGWLSVLGLLITS